MLSKHYRWKREEEVKTKNSALLPVSFVALPINSNSYFYNRKENCDLKTCNPFDNKYCNHQYHKE